MRRQGYYKKRERKPDSKYGRIDMGRFINYLMESGKKTVAEKSLYKALDYIDETLEDKDPIEVFEDAVDNASPTMEVVSRRIGGANYQIPRKVRPDRKFFLGTHWIINAAKSGHGKPLHERLADELIAAANEEGSAIKKKESVHRMAEANKAFASFLR